MPAAGEAPTRRAVCAFFETFDPNVDEAIVDYVSGVLSEHEDEQLCCSGALDDLQDLLEGASEAFCALPHDCKAPKLLELVQKVGWLALPVRRRNKGLAHADEA